MGTWGFPFFLLLWITNLATSNILTYDPLCISPRAGVGVGGVAGAHTSEYHMILLIY